MLQRVIDVACGYSSLKSVAIVMFLEIYAPVVVLAVILTQC
jgi:hypothetical protein